MSTARSSSVRSKGKDEKKMGTKLKDIVIAKETNLLQLSGKVLVVDAFNTLYQFLASIRQRDGTPLMNSKGKVVAAICHAGWMLASAEIIAGKNWRNLVRR